MNHDSWLDVSLALEATGSMFGSCAPGVHGGGTAIIGLVDREASSPTGNELRTTLGPGLSDLPDVGGIEDLGGGEDLDALGVVFDLTHLKEFEAEVDAVKGTAAAVGGEITADAAAAAIATAAAEAAVAAEVASAVVDAAVDGNAASGGPIDGGAGVVASQSAEELSRENSFSIGGIGISRQNSATGGELLSHQSSFDLNTMMQVRQARWSAVGVQFPEDGLPICKARQACASRTIFLVPWVCMM